MVPRTSGCVSCVVTSNDKMASRAEFIMSAQRMKAVSTKTWNDSVIAAVVDELREGETADQVALVQNVVLSGFQIHHALQQCFRISLSSCSGARSALATSSYN